MAEQRVSINSGKIRLEGFLDDSPGARAAVVTHPHPTYGGDMNNNVVEALVRTYKRSGYSTLRFNFRGVGNSEGTYEQGIGEQEDVKAAVMYMKALGKDFIELAGYSFGAWVNARGLMKLEDVERLVMVSPPVNFIDFSFLEFSPKIQLIITGAEDDIAPPGTIEKMLPTWNSEAEFKIIDGADHFYWNKTQEIELILRDFLRAI